MAGYVVLRELGAGGMATVYLARHVALDRLVALKELRALHDPSDAQRFLRESRVAGSLAHPNIVTVFDYFERGGTPYIAMEYMPGGSLRPYVGHVTLPQAGGVLAEVLAGLAHAERRGIVHRDLKPENLMVTEDGHVKIADFGIAKATSAVQTQARLTATGTTLGTPAYMAPEQALGEDVGPFTDLYSVGVIAYEMLVGEVPFHDTEAPLAVLMRQVNEPVPSVASKRPDLDPAIARWVDALLVKDPAKRPHAAVDVWRDLEEALIAALGPRWMRDAALKEGAGYRGPAFETPPTAPRRVSRRLPAADPRARTRRPRVPPPAPPEPVTERVPPRRRSRRGLVALALLAVALAAVALGAARSRPASPVADTAKPAVRTSSEALSLAVPAGWQPLPAVPSTGLPLSVARAYAPEGRTDRAAVVYGVMPSASAGNTALLPGSFLASLGRRAGELPPRTRVTLREQALPAWRYRNLRPLGSERGLTVYVVPTSAGVATVACLAPPGGGAAMPAKRCEAVASTLHLLRAQPYQLGPSDAYAAKLTSTLGTLRTSADRTGVTLSTARTGKGRSQAARSLGGEYRRAARTLSAVALSPADEAANAQLLDALRQVADAYAALAKKAGRSTAAFTRARAAALQAEKGIDAALAAIGAAGYSSSGSGAGTAPGTPTTSAPAKAPQRTSCGSAGGDEQSDDASDDQGSCGGEP